MKEIKALIRPNMADKVINAIENLPKVPGLTVSNVNGWGHAKNGSGPRLTERVKLEIVVPEEEVELVLDTLIANARTGEGHYGDGIIFISAVDDAIRVRTGERGKNIFPC